MSRFLWFTVYIVARGAIDWADGCQLATAVALSMHFIFDSRGRDFLTPTIWVPACREIVIIHFRSNAK